MKTAARRAKTRAMSSGVAATCAVSLFMIASRRALGGHVGLPGDVELEEVADLVVLVRRPGEAVAFEAVEAAHGACGREELKSPIAFDAEPLSHQRDGQRGELAGHDRPDIDGGRPLTCRGEEAEVGLARGQRPRLQSLVTGLIQMEKTVVSGDFGLGFVAAGRTKDDPKRLGVVPMHILHSLKGGYAVPDLPDC